MEENIYIDIDIDSINAEIEDVVVYEELVNWGRPYNDGDEGKVVQDGALAIQGALEITANGTHDTTYYKEVKANVENTYTAEDVGKVVQHGNLVRQTSLTIEANGTYDTTRNNEVVAAVPNTYTAEMEGQVVHDNALTEQTTGSITANGTHDTTYNNAVEVDVPNSYFDGDENKVVHNHQLVAQTTKAISANGTHDTTLNDEVVVDVPNTYTAADEDKVVYNGALVAQTQKTVSADGSYDTTRNNRLIVARGDFEEGNFTENGLYLPSSGKSGFSRATVAVPNTYSAADEGKVVSNGALVTQVSGTVEENGTVDTTLINSLLVKVSGGSGGILEGSLPPTDDMGKEGDFYFMNCKDCLISTGSEYLVLPFKDNQVYSFDIIYRILETGNSYNAVMGARRDNFTIAKYNNYSAYYRRRGTEVTMHSQAMNETHWFTDTGAIANVDAVNRGSSYGASAVGTYGWNILVFGVRYNSVERLLKMQLYYLELRDADGIPLAKYVPCLDEENVACVRDTISGSYVYNSGGGAFSLGEGTYKAFLRKIDGKWTKQRSFVG